MLTLCRSFCVLWLGVALTSSPPMAQQPNPAVETNAEKVFHGHLDSITMGAFTPDGGAIVTAGFDQTVRLWDVDSQSELRRYSQHTGPVFCLAISGDGTTLVTGAQDNTLRVWDLPLGSPSRILSAHEKKAGGIALSPLGDTLVSVSDDQSVRIHSLRDADPTATLRAGHRSSVLSVAYRPDGAFFATSDAEGRVLLWSPYLEQPQGELFTQPHSASHIQFPSNNQQLITAGDDGVMRVWQLMPQVTQQHVWGDTPLIDWSLITGLSQAVGVDEGGQVSIWNVASGEAIRQFPKLDFKPTAITHAPNQAWVAIADDAGKAHLFNFGDGAARGRVTAHEGKINDIAIHPDSNRFATCGQDGMVSLWTPSSSEDQPNPPLQTWTTDEQNPIAATTIVFTPDQQHVLCGAVDGKIRQWNLSSGDLVRTIEAHTDLELPSIRDVMVTPNAKWIVSVGHDQTLRTWSLVDGSQGKVMRHPCGIRRVSVSPDSTRAAVACEDGLVRVWDLATGQFLQSLAGHSAEVIGVGFLSDGQSVVSIARDRSLSQSKTSIVRAAPIHVGAIRSMALLSGGAQVVTCGDDLRVVATNVSTGAPLRSYHPGTKSNGETPTATEFHPTVVATRSDNQRVVAGTDAGEVLVWDAASGESPLFTLRVGARVTAVGYSPDNQKLAVATAEPAVHLFGPSIPGSQPTLELTSHQRFDTEARVSEVVFSTDNLSVFAAFDNGQIQQWNYAGIAQRRQLAHGGAVYGAALSKDGKLAVTCSTDQTVRVWNTETGQQKAQLRGHVGTVHAIAMNQDETFAVSSGADGTLRLWDIVGGRQLKQLTKFDATMYSIAIHPEGQLIAAAGADRKVHLLDMITGEERQTLEGHTDYIHCVAFDPTGARLLSYGYAGHLKLWNSASGELLQETRVGKVGNYAQFSPDARQILLSNGDATSRVIAAPSP